VYFIVLQSKDAFVYACPPRLLAYAEPSPETDYSIQRSHVARIPRPPDPSDSDSTSLPQPPPLTRVDYCVLSTEPNHGRNTISVANIMRTAPDGRQIPHSLEITFWPRPVRPARTAFKSDEEYERAEGKLMLPAQTVTIPGSLTNQPGNAWELLVIANSGLAVVLVVDPPPDPDAPPPADGFGGELDEEAALLALERRPAPKLVMARYDPVRASVSMHELQIPAGTGEGDLRLDTRGICALAFDDHRGFVIVVTVHRVLHYIPYA
jgi:hypothetical protein